MAAEEDKRVEPESFLGLVPGAQQRGRLKIYAGAAAGVGKTCQMLAEAHQLRKRGVDVVVGLVETHGRAETAAWIGDLEVIPRRKVEYRAVVLEEMDLDAILARRPEMAVVDELAHTNAPGSRHEKRFQDVEELLAAGISVIGAVNIQHVESLAPLVKRITGTEVRETVPDTFIARADQIVDVDLAVEELRERLREGKIYPPESIERALRNFFKPSNLASLRELALREVARSLDRQRQQRAAAATQGGRMPSVSERIAVALSSNPPRSDSLLRKAARIAGQLNAGWYAVHVETPSESVQKISTRDFRALLDNINLAADLGAETVWLRSDDVVGALLDFAREKGVTKIIVGRTRQPFWSRWFRRPVAARLIARARNVDIEVLADNGGDPSS